ncbi:MAG: ArsR family transcriptional regulator [Candidatus Thermoplasmatota archaeon]|nr:ArsR family transcriptional regulator [Candidatus Thermoplasmatota archaeon]
MSRVKVIKDVSEMVPILRAVSTKTKRDVYTDLAEDWKTEEEIEEEYGEEGKNALKLFDKMKLVETRWQHTGRETRKAYHTYYSEVHIDASVPIDKISDVLYAAMIDEEEFKSLEQEILESVREGDTFANDVSKKIGHSVTTLKSLVKRSVQLNYKGHRIEEVKKEG